MREIYTFSDSIPTMAASTSQLEDTTREIIEGTSILNIDDTSILNIDDVMTSQLEDTIEKLKKGTRIFVYSVIPSF